MDIIYSEPIDVEGEAALSPQVVQALGIMTLPVSPTRWASYDASYLNYYMKLERTLAGERLNDLRVKKALEVRLAAGLQVCDLFDVGCGTGAFLHAMRSSGGEALVDDDGIFVGPMFDRLYGVDVNPCLLWESLFTRDRLPIVHPDVFSFGRANRPQEAPCVCTFWDSLEHMLDPIFFLRTIAVDGLAVSMPNLQAWYDHCGGPDKGISRIHEWKHFKPGEHLWHMTPTGLRKLLEFSGYEVIGPVTYEENEIRVDPLLGPTNIMTLIAKRKVHESCYPSKFRYHD